MKRALVTIGLIVLTSIIGLIHSVGMNTTMAAQNAFPEKQKSAARNLAILIFDGVQIIDYTGPYETFGHVYNDDGPAFNVYTVSEKTNAITTAMGMSVNPKYSLENAPEPDIVLVPGGDVDHEVVAGLRRRPASFRMHREGGVLGSEPVDA